MIEVLINNEREQLTREEERIALVASERRVECSARARSSKIEREELITTTTYYTRGIILLYMRTTERREQLLVAEA